MKKCLLTIIVCSFINCISFAQITGSTTVCAGYTYSYSVNIAGAATYTWTLPTGWYDLSGQTTSQISVTCNVSDGAISVEGFASNGTSVGIQILTTQFSAGSGWDVNPNTIFDCANQTVNQPIFVNSNGTGGGAGCPTGCGTGVQHPNIDYIIYDNPWPVGNYISNLSGTFLMPPFQTTYYVYKVDYTNGFTPNVQAILVSGGCGSATLNNTIQLTPTFPLPISFTQTPPNACIGDTVLINAIGKGKVGVN